jgi:SAM-dependent methyltransferase
VVISIGTNQRTERGRGLLQASHAHDVCGSRIEILSFQAQSFSKDADQDSGVMADTIYQTGEYFAKHPTYHVEDSAWKAEHIFRLIRKNNLQPRTVCEIGCGAGEVLRQLQLLMSDEVQFEGYEISPQAFTRCQERANDRLRFQCADLLALDTDPCDLLLCIDVFEHVEDYLGFLRKLRAKAENKLFHIPLDLSVQWVLRGRPIMKQREEVGHLHYFTKETALATLRDAGYEVIDWCYTPGALLNPRSFKAKLASLPRKLLSALNQDLTSRVLGGYSLLVLAK